MWKFLNSARQIVFGNILDSRESCSIEAPKIIDFLAKGGIIAEPDIEVVPQAELDIEAVKTYPKFVALRNMTPTQVGAWVDANVTNFAEAKDALKTLAMAVCILARRL